MNESVMRHRVQMTWKLRAPFLFRGNDPTKLGFDEAFARLPDRRIFIPGDQVRGIIREMLGEVRGALSGSNGSDIERWFGQKSVSESDVEEGDRPRRGTITFSDLVAEEKRREIEPYCRIEIDDETGASRNGALQFIEQAVKPRAEVVFRGLVVIYATKSELDILKRSLDVSCEFLLSVGAHKSSGFGEVVEANAITVASEPIGLPSTADDFHATGTRYRFNIRFDRPLLVDADRLAGNVFSGSAIIPGAVLKGAVATQLHLAGAVGGDIDRVLSQMRFGHAFPGEQENCVHPVPPMSVAIAKADDQAGKFEGESKFARYLIADALLADYDTPLLIQGHCPAYAPDWKGDMSDAAFAATGMKAPSQRASTPRTRTALLNGVAEEASLFTFIARDHIDAAGNPLSWGMTISLANVSASDRPIALRIMSILTKGLDQVGKTDASAYCEAVTEFCFPKAKPVAGTDDTYAIVLRTPALILDLNALHDQKTHDWALSPDQAYRRYFEEIIPGATLETFFASQTLAGGYLAHRRRVYGKSKYYPFLLTDAGSVFLISGVERKALDRLIEGGLPVPNRLEKAITSTSWRNCPFVPQNGYGDFTAQYLSEPAVKSALTQEIDNGAC